MIYIITFILVGLAIAGIAIKIIVKKMEIYWNMCKCKSIFNRITNHVEFVVNSQLKLSVKILN